MAQLGRPGLSAEQKRERWKSVAGSNFRYPFVDQRFKPFGAIWSRTETTDRSLLLITQRETNDPLPPCERTIPCAPFALVVTTPVVAFVVEVPNPPGRSPPRSS